jgi:cyclic pyranopterin phosphate synthase
MTRTGFPCRQGRQLVGLTQRINVSLDSLLPARFERMVRRDGSCVQDLEGCVGGQPDCLIKVNCVVMRYNDDELLDFVRLGREEDFQVRFIEYMPLDAQGEWNMQTVVPGAEILARIDAAYPLLRESGNGSEPATVYRFADGRGSIGVIACGHGAVLRLLQPRPHHGGWTPPNLPFRYRSTTSKGSCGRGDGR